MSQNMFCIVAKKVMKNDVEKEPSCLTNHIFILISKHLTKVTIWPDTFTRRTTVAE